MQLCCLSADECPTLKALESGNVVDRRHTDAYPDFPSEFSYVVDEMENVQ
jgi:hypothetical protein